MAGSGVTQSGGRSMGQVRGFGQRGKMPVITIEKFVSSPPGLEALMSRSATSTACIVGTSDCWPGSGQGGRGRGVRPWRSPSIPIRSLCCAGKAPVPLRLAGRAKSHCSRGRHRRGCLSDRTVAARIVGSRFLRSRDPGQLQARASSKGRILPSGRPSGKCRGFASVVCQSAIRFRGR